MRSTIQIVALVAAALPVALSAPLPKAEAQLVDGLIEAVGDVVPSTIYDGPEPVTNANVAGIIKVVGDLTAEDLFGKREAKAQLEDVLETAGDLLDLPNVYDWVDDEVVPGVTEIVDTVGDFDLFGRSTNN